MKRLNRILSVLATVWSFLEPSSALAFRMTGT
jgi:hypothetical protein